MEELKKNIEAILDQFAKEEYGNRLSQFAFLGLKGVIIQTLNKEEQDGRTHRDPVPEATVGTKDSEI